jgi:hypothetical protein
MHQYKNTVEGFRVVKRKSLKILIPMFAVMGLSAMFGMVYDDADASQNAGIYIALSIFFVLIFVFVTVRALKRQREVYTSYVLTIDDTHVTRTQLNSPSVSISTYAISSIKNVKNGGICIVGEHKNDVIYILPQIEEYVSIKGQLSAIKPISTTKSDAFWQKYAVAFVFLPFFLMAGLYMAHDKLIVGACGILLVISLIWSIYKIQSNKNLDKKLRRSVWWIAWIIVCAIVIMYQKIIANY